MSKGVAIISLYAVSALAVTLSSNPMAKEGHITACPSTNITITCRATQVLGLRWSSTDEYLDQSSTLVPDSTSVRGIGPYTLRLLASNCSGSRADLVSRVEVSVEDIKNGTTITCRMANEHKSVTIYKAS